MTRQHRTSSSAFMTLWLSPQSHKFYCFCLKGQTPDRSSCSPAVRPLDPRTRPSASKHHSVRLFAVWNRRGLVSLISATFTKTRQKARTDPANRAEQRGGSGVSLGPSFVPHPPLCSLNPINLHPLCLLMEAAAALDQAALIYLQRRKPGVPSGPVGWRIAWLIGRTGSNCGCTLTRGGLVWKEKKYSTLYT